MYSVFLVEDEKLIREGIRHLIEWADYDFELVGEAADGELALPSILQLKPDIIITDIKMPFMDGLELSRRIKKEIPKTLIIIISGYDEFAYAQEAISIGISQYLLKPVTKNQLIQVLLETRDKKDSETARERREEKLAEIARQFILSKDQPKMTENEESSQEVQSVLLNPAIQYIKENYANSEISLIDAANAAGVVPSYFSAEFSRQVGKTFTEYLTEVRMKKAKKLLRETNMRSGEIALEVGYNDPHYFSFLFKKQNGCTPKEYRAGR